MNLPRLQLTVILGSVWLCGCTDHRAPACVRDLWTHLTPYDRECEDPQRKLTDRLALRQNRLALTAFVTDELSRRSVQHEDQLRLAWIVAALRARVTAEERPAISKAMRRGVKHTDFLAHSLWPPSPEYIAVAFEALRTPEATTYQGADSVSGQRKTRSLHEFVVGMLREATNRDFGASAQAWERWWEDEGRFLEWDQDQMIYRKR